MDPPIMMTDVNTVLENCVPSTRGEDEQVKNYIEREKIPRIVG